METVSKAARREIVAAIRARYARADRSEKSRILAELVQLSGYHRKHAIRLLTSDPAPRSANRFGRRVYDDAVKGALTLIWEAADRICGKRLKATIPTLVCAMERCGHLSLERQVREGLLSLSAATIDRILRPIRATAGARRRRRPVRRVSKEVPIKTFTDWQDPEPGFLEIDFVVHGGGSMAGEYLHSFVATDVCSGWVEGVSLLAREQSLVIEGLKRMAGQLPVPILGINSDNDSAFINEALVVYCKERGIAFTRSRAHQKNDQAWIEQKNGAVIRRMVGHDRLSGIVAGQALAQLLQVVRLYVNFFQPSFKLKERKRQAGRVIRKYHAPATPCERLLAHSKVSEAVKEFLRQQQARLDPVELLHRIRQGQAALAALSKGDIAAGPSKESLDMFLAALPEMWRRGEVRPTHRKPGSKRRYWRSREDPLKDCWTDILLWLQADPDITGKSIMGRLDEKYPGMLKPGVLRTVQRRIREWRQTMAKRLVLGTIEEPHSVSPVMLTSEASACPPPGEVPLRLADASLRSTSPGGGPSQEGTRRETPFK